MNSPNWRRTQWMTFAAGGVPAIVALVLIWTGPGVIANSPALRWSLTTIVLGSWVGLGLSARERIVERLRTFSNIASAFAPQNQRGRKFAAQPPTALSGVKVQTVQGCGPDPDFYLVWLHLRFRPLRVFQDLRAAVGFYVYSLH